ncbi:MAG TPA: serine/threonine protein phosphatase [Rhizobiales bacterium]|nr:serine/threonine protein phosphatase [Hyphomicrobiales bacterium]
MACPRCGSFERFGPVIHPVYYAIGDIHGEADRLMALHRRISAFHDTHYKNRAQIRIHLGDYIDRGPDSYKAIKYVMEMEKTAPFRLINLMGNHESLMLAACESRDRRQMDVWLNNGGEATLLSYQEHGYAFPPTHHRAWMRNLPTRYYDRENGLVFVHAGIDPEVFPGESGFIRLWTRSEAFFASQHWQNPALNNIRVIHGHTPTGSDTPDISADGRRINIDTGACYNGRLTAVVIAPHEKLHFLTA